MSLLIDGIYEERADDMHVGMRERMLDTSSIGPNWSDQVARFPARSFGNEFACNFRHELRDRGIIRVALDEPMSTTEFADFAGQLGTPVPELDPATEPFVERDVVLNLVTRYGETDDASLQPFATGFVTLHTESSGRSVADQPRYIVLMCREPGDASAAASVLVAMKDVADLLDPGTIATLASTRYRRSPAAPMIAREEKGRCIFSFRDFWRQPLEWSHAGAATHADIVNDAIRGLLAAMYGASGRRIAWTRGLLVIIDNHFFFHGKSAARATAGRARHLQRLRIRSGP